MLFSFEKVIKESLYPPMHHAISVEKMGQRIMAVWYSASYETSVDSVVYVSHYEEGKWSVPKLIVELAGFGLGNPVIWHVPDKEETWLLFSILTENDWKSAMIARKVSKNGGKTWSEIEILNERKGLMTKGRPLKLSSEKYLIPIYDEKRWSPMVLVSKSGKEWKLYGDTTIKGVIQPNVVELQDGTLLMLSRSKKGKVYFSRSFNQGLSWISSSKTNVPNPNSGIDFVKIEDEELFVLAYNHSEFSRNRIDIAISYDGISWSEPLNIMSGKGEYSYPCILIDENELHIFFTQNRTNFVDAHANFEKVLNALKIN